jgi:hypothetical protein
MYDGIENDIKTSLIIKMDNKCMLMMIRIVEETVTSIVMMIASMVTMIIMIMVMMMIMIMKIIMVMTMMKRWMVITEAMTIILQLHLGLY